jgi:hypothetical protein
MWKDKVPPHSTLITPNWTASQIEQSKSLYDYFKGAYWATTNLIEREAGRIIVGFVLLLWVQDSGSQGSKKRRPDACRLYADRPRDG